METEITIKPELINKRKKVILWFKIYLAGSVLGLIMTMVLIINVNNMNLSIALILITAAMMLGFSVTFWQRIYYRAKYGKYNDYSAVAADKLPEEENLPEDAVPPQTEEILTEEVMPQQDIEPEVKELKGFGVYFTLFGKSVQWLIMGFLFVTILNIVHILPRGKRSMLNILMRFFAFAVFFPYSLIGLILMIFIWGKPRTSLSKAGNKIIDWYDYDQS